MKEQNMSSIQEDLIVRMIKSQIELLSKVLNHIETGNGINEFVNDNLKRIQEELRWLRKFYCNH